MKNGYATSPVEAEGKMTRNRTEVRSLTGLRGFAALAVAVHHFSAPSDSQLVVPRFSVPGAYLAVDIFFIMSGFVLAYNYADVFSSGTSAGRYLSFLAKRIARIYPAYLVFLALYTIRLFTDMSGGNAINQFGRWDIIGNLLMVHGWGVHVRPLIGPSGSVSSEMFCYLLFPVAIRYALLSKRFAVAAAVVSTLGLMGVAFYGHGATGPLDVVGTDDLWPLIRAICGFSIGIVLSLVETAYRTRINMMSNALSVFALLCLVACWTLDVNDLFRYPFMALLVLALSQDGSVARLLFANRPIYYLGVISYSVYICHALLVSFFLKSSHLIARQLGDSVGFWTAFVLYLAAVIVISSLSYPFIEVRGRKFVLRRLSRFLD